MTALNLTLPLYLISFFISAKIALLVFKQNYSAITSLVLFELTYILSFIFSFALLSVLASVIDLFIAPRIIVFDLRTFFAYIVYIIPASIPLIMNLMKSNIRANFN
jgi:hypothetical protein